LSYGCVSAAEDLQGRQFKAATALRKSEIGAGPG